MEDKNKIEIEFSEVQLRLIDSLMPWYGSAREEVVKNIIMRWVEENIGTEKMRALKLIGVIK